MSGSNDEELEEELQRNGHYQMAQMYFGQGASGFAQGWAELNWAHDHFRSTEQWDKAARITEERADAMLAVRREKDAAFLFDSAGAEWRRHGEDLQKQGQQKVKAVEAYHCALTNFERAISLDPHYRTSPITLRLKELTEQAIKDLQTP